MAAMKALLMLSTATALQAPCTRRPRTHLAAVSLAELAEQSSRLAARIHDGDFRDRTWSAEVVIGVVT